MSEKMYDDGYCNIENIDISQVVIDQMTERNISRPKMTCLLSSLEYIEEQLR